MARKPLRGALTGLAMAACFLPPGSAAWADDAPVNQAELIHNVLPSVVSITARAQKVANTATQTVASHDAGDSFEVQTSAGSGFVVDPSGTILTNWHVVAGAYQVVVTFSDGNQLEADVVNAARLIDLALLQVKPEQPLQAAVLGDSDRVQVGDSVLAIGNPLGIGTSVTRGIVSALHRNISDTPYDDFIQTDAAINHGNSGGPLFNLKGEVIGVDSAIVSPTAANAGLGFALPANQAHFVIEQLKRYGWVRPGWLGLKIQDLTEDMAKALMLPPRGAIVAWVSAGGPAEQAGLQIGDVITRFEEDHPADERALLRDIAGSPPGRHVTLGLVREGKSIDLPVTLGEWPRMAWEAANAPLKVAPPHWVIPADLGIKLTELTEQLRGELGVPADRNGAYVVDVSHGTDAAHRGLKPGDVIIKVGSVPVGSAAAVQQQIDALRLAGRSIAMFLVFPKTPGNTAFPSPKWMPLRIGAG